MLNVISRPKSENAYKGSTLSSGKNLHKILRYLFNRMDTIDQQCPADQFPLYSIGNDDQWVISRGGSWTGGFWAGCWWLRSLFTESVVDEKKALTICQNLNSKLSVDSINRSMIFWYGNGLGAQLAHSPYAKKMAHTAANALIDSYSSKLQFIPVGMAMGGGEKGSNTLVIDTLSPLLQLCLYSNNKRAERVALNHLNTTINACFNDDGSWYEKVSYENKKIITEGEPGNWARGHAWGLLGLSRAAFYWGEPYIGYAIKALKYWEFFLPNTEIAVDCINGKGAKNSDPSAMLIVALAVSILSKVKFDKHFSDTRKKYLQAIINSQYLSISNNTALFYGTNATVSANEKNMVESTWGIYFLMLCLGVELKYIDPAHI